MPVFVTSISTGMIVICMIDYSVELVCIMEIKNIMTVTDKCASSIHT